MNRTCTNLRATALAESLATQGWPAQVLNSAVQAPFAQYERGHAAVPSAHMRHGAPMAGQSASLAHLGLGAGWQIPGQSAPPFAGSQASFGSSTQS